MFRLLPNGFANRDLRRLLAELLGKHIITAGQMSYDLRRLRLHGLITRVPRSNRYRLTDTGLHHATLLTHVHTRILLPGLAHLTDPDPPQHPAHRGQQLSASCRSAHPGGLHRSLNPDLTRSCRLRRPQQPSTTALDH